MTTDVETDRQHGRMNETSAGLDQAGSPERWPVRLKRFHTDDSGEHSMEVLMILVAIILPMISVIFMMEDILREYVAFGQIFITSPFF